MHITYRKDPSIAPIAWIARIHRDTVEVVHGSMLATQPHFFHDGVWAGDFARGAFDREFNSGTGGMLEHGALTLVSSDAPIECIYLTVDMDTVLASNSMAFLMAATDDELDVEHLRYRDEMLAAERGVRLGSLSLPTARGGSIRVLLGEIGTVHGPDDIRFRHRPMSPPFRDWTHYRRVLDDTVAAVFANAQDPERDHRFTPMVMMSSGYDSTAAATLAAGAGATDGITMLRRHPPDDVLHDHPGRIAEALDLELIEVERDSWRTRTDLPEADLAASITTMGAVSLLAMDPWTSGRLVVTGSSGDTVWDANNHRCYRDFVHGYGHLGERGLVEHRLQMGYARFSPAEIGQTAHPSIHRITQSEALRPWRVGGVYDRPIPRRIAEEAGVPRESFGYKKYGASYRVGHSRTHYSGTSESEMRSELLETMSPAAVASFLEFLGGIDLRRYRLPMASDRAINWLYEKLDALNHRVGLKLHRIGMRSVAPRPVMRYLGRRATLDADYTRWLPHWGVGQLKARYSHAAATFQHSFSKPDGTDPQ